jgi:hypothetical protein
MCGILGYIGKRDATPLLIEGLRRVEYRGLRLSRDRRAAFGRTPNAKCKPGNRQAAAGNHRCMQGELARTMSAQRLPGTSALAALKSVRGSSTSQANGDRAMISEVSRFLWPVPSCGAVRPGNAARAAYRGSLSVRAFRGRPDKIYCGDQSATGGSCAHRVKVYTRGAGRPFGT